METIIFEKINGLIPAESFLSDAVIFFGSSFPYLIILVVLTVFVFPNLFTTGIKERTLRIGIVTGLFAAFFARYGVKELITFFYSSPRPFEVLDGVNQLIPHDGLMNSFPSGHTIFFFALGTVLVFYSRSLGIFVFISGLFVGLARIASGIHWPSDVIGGASIGILVGVLFFAFLASFVYLNGSSDPSFKTLRGIIKARSIK